MGTQFDPFEESFVLLANAGFYRAFAERDMAAMRALWAASQPVVCLHPGWPALFGRTVVLESWERILASPQSPEVLAYGARVVAHGGLASVICYEQLGGGVCVAANAFVLEDGELRLVSHQSGACQVPPPNDDPATTWQ